MVYWQGCVGGMLLLARRVSISANHCYCKGNSKLTACTLHSMKDATIIDVTSAW
jgi:hypothetical protein